MTKFTFTHGNPHGDIVFKLQDDETEVTFTLTRMEVREFICALETTVGTGFGRDLTEIKRRKALAERGSQ